MSLQERIDRWVSRLLARVLHKLLAKALPNVGRQAPRQPQVAHQAIPLRRDPWCGTYVSSEISFPLEHAGQVLHFCSAECRERYQRSSRRAASA